MNEQDRNYLANKYAIAFLNVFMSELTPQSVTDINNAVNFLLENHRLLFLLQLPMISSKTKKQGIEILCQKLSLPTCITQLCNILIDARRLFLMSDIFPKIYTRYFKRVRILNFTFSSYPVIEPGSCEQLKEFLADKTGYDIMYTYKEDKKLIAGIRLQSDTYLWEHSLAQQLKRLQLPLAN